jgi:hypothetical protein
LRQPERAVNLAKQNGAAHPKDVRTLTVLGLATYRAGYHLEAVKLLEKAETTPGKYEGGSFILALCHWRLGNKKKAAECYQMGNAWMEQFHPLDEELRGLHAEAKMLLGL